MQLLRNRAFGFAKLRIAQSRSYGVHSGVLVDDIYHGFFLFERNKCHAEVFVFEGDLAFVFIEFFRAINLFLVILNRIDGDADAGAAAAESVSAAVRPRGRSLTRSFELFHVDRVGVQ